MGLELAATWVRLMSCREIVREIEQNRDFLATTLRNVPERHRSLRAVFEHSWQLLSESERAVLQKLAIFRGGFRREAAEAVADASLLMLSALVDKSLLKHTLAGRYEIHELLRQFSQEKLGEDPGQEERTRDRHCRYYADFLNKREADLRGDRDKEVLEELEAEIDNVRAGWRWAVAHKNEEMVEKYLASLEFFYYVRGWYQEAVETFGRGPHGRRDKYPSGETPGAPGKFMCIS
jgi:predicted ATPase